MNETLRQSLINSLSASFAQGLATRGENACNSKLIKMLTYEVVDLIEAEEAKRARQRDIDLLTGTIDSIKRAREARDMITTYVVLGGFANNLKDRWESPLYSVAYRIGDNLKKVTPVSLDDEDIAKALGLLMTLAEQLERKGELQ